MKVCFDTFGCRLNRAEALAQQAGFIARGWTTTDKHSEADMIVVRGCSVTARAERDCKALVEHIKEKYPNKRLVVTGCLKDKRNELLLRDVKDGIDTSTARAYLKVQDGCSQNCSFCIIPRFRGKSVSIAFENVLDNAKAFIDAGYREIVVTGCNLSSYSYDGKTLVDLVDALSQLDPQCRIRLGSIEPGAVALELVDAIAGRENICHFFHLAVQSGAAVVLSAMRRPYTIHHVNDILAAFSRKVPDGAIGLDLMTGFPGERDLEFLATKMLFNRYQIAKAHIFPYSERPGTPAETLSDVVPKDVRRERARELAALADESRTRFAKKFMAKDVEIVVEDEENIAGWTSQYLWCKLQKSQAGKIKPKRKERFTMHVTATDGHMLIGEAKR